MLRIIFTYLLLLLTFLLKGQDVTFTAKISHTTVEIGQQFQVTYTINSRGGNFTPPSFQNLQRLGGPNQSQFRHNINGKISQSTSIGYILRATKTGTITIDGAKFNVNGKIYESNPLTVNVVDQNPNSANAQSNRQNEREQNGESISDYTFMKAIVNKRSAYIGENVTVTFKVYSRLPIKQFLGLEQNPSLNGFYQQELGGRKNLTLEEEVIDGVRYQTLEIQELLLFPQRSGELTIDPMAVKLGVQVQSRRARSYIEQLMGSYELKEVITKSTPITITVKKLPIKGKPNDFTGAVGNFKMKMTASKDSIVANEALDIKISLSGTGNIPLINAPQLNFPPDFEVYDPETKNNFSLSASGATGSKTFNYLVIPRHSGEFKLPAYKFSYFDIASKSYKVITADPTSIYVKKGADEQNVVFNGINKEKVELLNQDIRYIHLNGISLHKVDEQFYGSTLFYLLIVLFVSTGLGLFAYAKKSAKARADVVGLRKSKANKMAKKRLALAKKHLDSKNNVAFYEEISVALFGYFADKFNLSVAELSQEKIIEVIPQKELKDKVKIALEEAEMARFAPSSGINPTILYEQSVDIIQQSENVIKQ